MSDTTGPSLSDCSDVYERARLAIDTLRELRDGEDGICDHFTLVQMATEDQVVLRWYDKLCEVLGDDPLRESELGPREDTP